MTNWSAGGAMTPQKVRIFTFQPDSATTNQIVAQQEDGTFKISLPLKPDRLVPMVQPQLDTGMSLLYNDHNCKLVALIDTIRCLR